MRPVIWYNSPSNLLYNRIRGFRGIVERLEDMKYVMMGNYGVRREVVNFDDLVEIVKSSGIE